MRVVSAVALGLVLLCAPVSAQTPASSVMEHYRAYSAALEQRDLAAAETEAELALAASEAGNGSRTAVLAFNLAQVRVWRNNLPGALAPAQRALELSQAGAQGVDVNYATLLLARAELATSGEAGAQRLSALLASADFSGIAEEAYFAAAQLGVWAMSHRRFDVSQQAWSRAALYATGATVSERINLAHARIWEGAAIISAEFASHRRSSFNSERVGQAYALLSEATVILAPLSAEETSGGELTVAQTAYAQSLAWSGILRARTGRTPARNAEEDLDFDEVKALGVVDQNIPFCQYRLVRPPGTGLSRYYPREALQESLIASVVLRLIIDDTGAILDRSVAANVGSSDFAVAVRRMSRGFRVERLQGQHNCRMPHHVLVPIIFTMN